MDFANNAGVLALIAISAFVVAVSIVVLSWNQPQQEELGAWAAGLVVLALGHVLLAVRSASLPSSYGLLFAANLSLVVAFVLIQWSVLRFQGRSWHWTWMALPILALVLITAVGRSNFPLRASAVGAVLGLQLLTFLITLNHKRFRQSGRGLRLVNLSIGMAIAFTVLRSIAFALGLAQPISLNSPSASPISNSWLNGLTLLVVMMGTISSSIGYIFMSKERVDARNREMATLDPLTGIFNRGAIVAALERDVARALRSDKPLGVLMVDVDHFKSVNDRWGHLAGDAVLRHVADMLRARVRSQDLVGRYGGEEFLIVLPETDQRGAHQVAQQLKDGVARSPSASGAGPIPVTVSIGVHADTPRAGDGWDRWVQQADLALYKAKARGRNCIVLAGEGDEPPALRLAA